jgi:hypothetical protein
LRTVLFDSFRLLRVKMDEITAGSSFDPKQLIELCVYRLRITMLGTLNEERHNPGGHGSRCLPVKGFRVRAR